MVDFSNVRASERLDIYVPVTFVRNDAVSKSRDDHIVLLFCLAVCFRVVRHSHELCNSKVLHSKTKSLLTNCSLISFRR